MSKEEVAAILEQLLNQVNEVVATFPDDEPKVTP